MQFAWDDLRLFLAVAEQGSLSAAARSVRLGQPTLSRRIAEMEANLGSALFVRDSQGMHLTAAGSKLLPAARGMADWALEAEASVQVQARLEGRVRLAAPPGVALEIVAPLAAKIRRAHPELQLEVLSGVSVLNLARGEADISLRTLRPTDADLICLEEAKSPVRAYASPDYVARLPKGVSAADLDWICWATSYDHLITNRALEASIPGFKPAFASDDFNVQLAACRAGLGVMPLIKALQGDQSRLCELDIDLGSNMCGELYLVVHKRQRHLPRVNLVLEYLQAELARLRDADK